MATFCSRYYLHRKCFSYVCNIVHVYTFPVEHFQYFINNYKLKVNLNTLERCFYISIDYDSRTLNNDVCLLYVKNPIIFDENTSPICVPPSYKKHTSEVAADTECMVAGWGRTSEGGKISPILQELAVPIIAHKKCASNDVYGENVYEESMICAGYLTGGKDGCQAELEILIMFTNY